MCAHYFVIILSHPLIALHDSIGLRPLKVFNPNSRPTNLRAYPRLNSILLLIDMNQET